MTTPNTRPSRHSGFVVILVALLALVVGLLLGAAWYQANTPYVEGPSRDRAAFLDSREKRGDLAERLALCHAEKRALDENLRGTEEHLMDLLGQVVLSPLEDIEWSGGPTPAERRAAIAEARRDPGASFGPPPIRADGRPFLSLEDGGITVSGEVFNYTQEVGRTVVHVHLLLDGRVVDSFIRYLSLEAGERHTYVARFALQGRGRYSARVRVG